MNRGATRNTMFVWATALPLALRTPSFCTVTKHQFQPDLRLEGEFQQRSLQTLHTSTESQGCEGGGYRPRGIHGPNV